MTVIGVATDVRFLSLTDEVAPIFYSPFARQSDGPTQLVVRLQPGVSAADDAPPAADGARSHVTSLDSRVPFASRAPARRGAARAVARARTG